VDRHYEAYTQTDEYNREYDYYLADAYFHSDEFLARFESWVQTPEGKNDSISDSHPARENYLRQKRFEKTSEYKKGYELWAKQPTAIFEAETKTRLSFEFSKLEPVIQDTAVISYYID
jgi:hypothetical protein